MAGDKKNSDEIETTDVTESKSKSKGAAKSADWVERRVTEMVGKFDPKFLSGGLILDGAEVLEEILENKTGVVSQFVKLVPTKENPMPCVRGKFLGYESTKVRAPNSDERRTMNVVLIESLDQPGVVARLLGQAMIMQGLANVKIGEVVTIARLNTPPQKITFTDRATGEEVDANINPFLVVPESRGTYSGSATPFGQWANKE